jgi:HSP20 family protein
MQLRKHYAIWRPKMRYMTKARPENMMDQIFDSMFYNTQEKSRVYSSFPVDITEEDDRYVVNAELAGFNEGDVDITLNDNLLVISAERIKKADKKKDKEKKEELQEKEYKYLLRERVERMHKRTFSLPKDADRETINASLKDGMLYLTIDKKPEAKPVSIKIN